MFIEKPDEEQNQTSKQQVNAPSIGAGGGVAGPDTQMSPGGPGGATPVQGNVSTLTPTQQPQQEQKWGTIQDYLSANKPQGEALANKFVSGLQTEAEKAKSDIGSAAEKATQDIFGGSVTPDQGVISEAVANPTAVAGDEQRLADFLKQWNAAYTGPESFEKSDEYQPAAEAVNKARTTAAELSSQGGRQQIMQDTFGVYGQGNQGLDTALLQSSGREADIQGLVPQFKSIGDYLASKSGEVNTQAEKASADTAAAQVAAKGAFSNTLTKFQNDLAAKVTTNRATADTLVKKYQDDLASGDLTKITADLKEEGFADAQIKPISDYLKILNKDYQANPDLKNYYNYNPSVDINQATVATPEDYAKAEAYQKLTGVDYGGVLNPADAAKAGTWNQINKGTDTQGIADYLKGNVTQRDKELLGSYSDKISITNELQKNLTDEKAGANVAEKRINALTRSGITPKTFKPAFPGDIPPVLANVVLSSWWNPPLWQAWENAGGKVPPALAGKFASFKRGVQELMKYPGAVDKWLGTGSSSNTGQVIKWATGSDYMNFF